MYYVYVLQNTNGQLYIGFTANLDERLKRHQEGKAGWTHSRRPWELVHHETFTYRQEAMRRERQLKSGRANQKLRTMLVQTDGRARPSDERKD
jgi:putative endonuclease